MTNLFLRAKHWQLFLVLFVLPVALQLYSYSHIFREIEPIPEPDMGSKGFTQVLNEEFIQFEFLPYTTILVALVFFGWIWSMAIGLQKKIPTDIPMKVKKFKIFFFVPFLYILFILISFTGSYPEFVLLYMQNLGFNLVLILPLHLLSMLGILYCLYFAAKTIKTVELQRKVNFGDFIGEFFLLWISFVGVWIIQPKVNRLHQDHNP
ncbi:hypothetical protein [Flagellimonas allohymeniacidonis]|uniref:Uncharacterized protein n=1 Tax=Flagellimonas allohymeniacidonis TaxID=2517819 RepID=A0A4Q8QCY7_9FLAO|nr:hypothetical protein [Allomuricauda hymeniacidonis]TAI46948.1 hypothetical protein EW142_09620 [Allomuricauda hymeniacidonis]